MKTIPLSELSSRKLNANIIPQSLIDSGYRVIHNNKVNCYVGIGWVIEKEFVDEHDMKNIPVVDENS